MTKLVTRNDLRKMGLNVSNMTFQRWERKGLLTPIKRSRYDHVRYDMAEVERNFFTPYKVAAE